MEMITQWMGKNVDTFTRDEAIAALKLAVHLLDTEAKIREFSREIKSYDPRLKPKVVHPTLEELLPTPEARERFRAHRNVGV